MFSGISFSPTRARTHSRVLQTLIDEEVPPASRIIITCEQVRLVMKSHAFIRENLGKALRYNPSKGTITLTLAANSVNSPEDEQTFRNQKQLDASTVVTPSVTFSVSFQRRRQMQRRRAPISPSIFTSCLLPLWSTGTTIPGTRLGVL